MNLFNCFQAMAFYTVAPLGIQYLFANGYTVAGWLLAIAETIGFVVISITIREK